MTYQRPFWREKGFSGNGMGYGGGPIQQLYDSCGPDGSEPYALCGFIFGAGAELPSDGILRPQVRAFCAPGNDVLLFCVSNGTFLWRDGITAVFGGGCLP